MSTHLDILPENLPVPEDDGAAIHLLGRTIPEIPLLSTQGIWENIAETSINKLLVLYTYPKTGLPDKALPLGWDMVPGARGCTIQNRSYKTEYTWFETNNIALFGLSLQDHLYQKEMKERLELPHNILSDIEQNFSLELSLPMFSINRIDYLHRLVMVIKNKEIIFVKYPIFPPGSELTTLKKWLEENELNQS